MSEFRSVIRFLDAHNIGFTRSDTRAPYNSTTIYADGHALRNLGALYDRERPAARRTFPLDAVVEALRSEGSKYDAVRRLEWDQAAAWLEREFGGDDR